MIIVSSACLAIDNPRLDATSDLAFYLTLANYAFTLIFFTECAAKIISMGFVFGEVTVM